ncbi:hypothetical protein MKEN_00925200 [Mycena kentingensis (nom. inval.)]|nr:hypothetical protein MKEN_00925200 [Mycena kentingensis (nom. inval.)]
MSTKTRRKSKAAAAEPDNSAAELTLTIPDDVDVDALSALLPGANVTTQSPDGIVELYRRLIELSADLDASIRERDEKNADVERMEVELDQALQDKESLSKDLEGSTENLQVEVRKLKQERDELASAKAGLQAQITTLSSTQSSSSTQTDALRHRLDDVEREKRDLVGVISRLKEDASQREVEIQTLRTNLKEARQEHQTLESQLRDLRSSDSATRFKLDSLQQQLELAQGESTRVNAELIAKSEEFSKQRRSQHAEIVTLQANFDSLTQTHASTQATLKSLQSAHTAQSHQLTQALTRVQDLSGQLAEQDAGYAAEANKLNRLVAAMQEREARTKDVVDGIEEQMSAVHEKAERREASLRDELRTETLLREEAEKRIEQLQEVVERIGRGDLPVPGPRALDLASDPLVGISPTVAMVSRAQKAGKTFTEVYTDYIRLQEDYSKKCTEYDRMDQTLSAVLAQIEERAPIISQQRAEYERLQSEASHLAAQLSQSIADRDTQAKLAQDNGHKLSGSLRENEVLQQQLTDLGRQVQHLLKEVGRRDDPSLPSDLDLEMLDAALPETIDGVITNNLVLFRSVGELQEQNQKLLKVVRDLGDKMESEEKEYREHIEREQGEAIREAHEAMQEIGEQLERQKASSESVIKAYVKENATLKAMLAREQGGSGGITNGATGRSEVNGFDLPSGELAKELAEVQNEFQTYRTEMGVDAVRLREDTLKAQREVAQLTMSLSKANAQIEFFSETQRRTTDQINFHNQEVERLTKAHQELFEKFTKSDIVASQRADDLMTANSRLEQLRNENANLRAEKRIWESVQERLVNENKSLNTERSNLSDLVTRIQKSQSDNAELTASERRRFESQIKMLEDQTQDLRTQLTRERETMRQLSFAKEQDGRELQSKIDKLSQELATTRESLIGADTSKTHLEKRVEDLIKQLKGSEEKLAVYGRPTRTAIGSSQAMDPDMTREQQLEAEVAELRAALKIAELDATNARAHAEQFREISAANEAALDSLNATHDQLQATTDAQIEQHKAIAISLEDKLKFAQEELSRLTAKHDSEAQSFNAQIKALADDKKVLEDTIAEISTSEQTSQNDRTYRETEARQLEDRAKAAEAKYDQEVVSHAESIKARRTLADAAQAKLVSSEGSWTVQKEALDKEINDLNRRCQDLTSQNSLLHNHLADLSSKTANIRQTAAAAPTADGDASSTTGDADTDTKLAELRSVVAYLRNEKEIADLQWDVSKQECARLKSQLDYLNGNLQTLQNTLSEERKRAVETAASAAQHQELVERMNQINVLRESNSTLRVEAENHAKRARELDSKLRAANAELGPLKEQVRTLKAELEARQTHVGRLEEENRKWQERNTQLLVKYDRTDPAELQALKDQIEALSAKLNEVEAEKTTLEAAAALARQRGDKLETSLRGTRETMNKNNATARDKIAKEKDTNAGLSATIAALETEIQALKSAAPADQPVASTSTADAATISALTAERDALLAEKATWVEKPAAIIIDDTEAKAAWETERAALVEAREAAETKTKDLKEKHDTLLQRAQGLKQKLTDEKNVAVAAAIAQTKAEMQAAAATSSAEPVPSEDLTKKHAEELKALETTLTTKHAQELKAAVEAAKMEAAATPGAVPFNIEAITADAIAKHDEEMAGKRQEEITAAVERGRAEAAARSKLKDQQLVRSQHRVKELEGLIQYLRDNKHLAPDAPTAVPASAAAATSAASAKLPAKPTPSTSTAPVASASGASTSGAKPPAATGAPTRGGGPARGGASRGAAAPNRGATRGRGGAQTRGGPPGAARAVQAAAGAAAAATGTPAAATAGGEQLSIAGASKRPREEGGTEEGTLAKRIKPLEGATPTAAASGKPPVLLRRPPAQPPAAP